MKKELSVGQAALVIVLAFIVFVTLIAVGGLVTLLVWNVFDLDILTGWDLNLLQAIGINILLASAGGAYQLDLRSEK